MDAINQYPDDVFLLYQSHRLLVWARDIDGASRVLPMLINSDLPEQNRELATLRQHCAELRIADAEKLHDRILVKNEGDLSINWLSFKIIGDDESAEQLFAEYDERGDLVTIATYLG